MNRILVTGGARGIGRAIADRAARDGYDVLIFDREAPAAHGQNAEEGEPKRHVLAGALFALRAGDADEAAAHHALQRVVTHDMAPERFRADLVVGGHHDCLGHARVSRWLTAVPPLVTGAQPRRHCLTVGLLLRARR